MHLPRGTVLADGDVLETEEGETFVVRAADEELSVAHSGRSVAFDAASPTTSATVTWRCRSSPVVSATSTITCSTTWRAASGRRCRFVTRRSIPKPARTSGTQALTRIRTTTTRIHTTMLITPRSPKKEARVTLREPRLELPLPSAVPPPASVALSFAGLFRLLQLSSPTLPIGAFAYSQGLETVVEAGTIADETTERDYLTGNPHGRHRRFWICRCSRGFTRLSSRTTRAPRSAGPSVCSRRGGRQSVASKICSSVVHSLACSQTRGLLEAAAWKEHAFVTHAAMVALAGARFDVPEAALLAGFAFSWAENQVSALSRLVPLGQLAAQRVLTAVASAIPAGDRARAGPRGRGPGRHAAGLALASALHETQYTRLFKS